MRAHWADGIGILVTTDPHDTIAEPFNRPTEIY
jgi:hypothetical protein